jgi:ubiquinone/menaquinone biosynthesis C-methylase UbiE
MEVSERIKQERAFHDNQAAVRARFFYEQPAQLLVADDDYINHETWIRPALSKLGSVRGKRVLDFGCGHGMASVVLARRGAAVTALDLSLGYLHEARTRAYANGVSVRFIQANGERLPFADRSFDRVWGNAVLHHLDIRRAAGELRRVLAPEGVAVFCEPWGGNPLVNWARRRLAYAGKERTPQETPLTKAAIEELRYSFPAMEVMGFQLLSMIARLSGPGLLVNALARMDRHVLSWFPRTQDWCRYAVLVLKR